MVKKYDIEFTYAIKIYAFDWKANLESATDDVSFQCLKKDN